MNEQETTEWIDEARPVVLLPGETRAHQATEAEEPSAPLPNGVEGILEHVASMAAGYDSGLKWNEEDKLRADLMNRPERRRDDTVEQVRATCPALGMCPDEVDTIAGYLQNRKDGKRFNVPLTGPSSSTSGQRGNLISQRQCPANQHAPHAEAVRDSPERLTPHGRAAQLLPRPKSEGPATDGIFPRG